MTGINISQIQDAKLRTIAEQADQNKDGKLKGEEYQIFAQEASKQGVDYKTISDTLEMNAFERWYFDVDKVSTDGKDDGHLSIGEKAESFGKGLVGGIFKGIAKHPIASALTIGAGIALTVATGGAAAPLLIAAGAAFGTGAIVKGAINASKATTDGEAKAAWEGIGTGTAVVALSAAGVKSANKTAANAGVKSLQGLENESWLTNVVEGTKALPESMKVSGMNIKGNALTWASTIKGDKTIYANSNATRSGVMTGTQAGNKVQDAYKVDLNGTVDEVLAKNPGLSYDAEAGKFYVQTSWGEKSYIQSDNYMYVQYGPGDANAVEGVEFYDTYIDHAKFEATGAKRYINPENLKPGEHVVTSKNAPARFKIVPEGTKYVGAEGEATVQPGSVLRIDGQGRPYQSTVEFMLKKVQLTPEQVAELIKLDPARAITTPVGAAYIKANNPQQYIELMTPEALAKTSEGANFLIENSPEAAVKMLESELTDMGIEFSKPKDIMIDARDFDVPGTEIEFQCNGKTFSVRTGGQSENILEQYKSALENRQNLADRIRNGYYNADKDRISLLKDCNREIWNLQSKIDALTK